MIEHFEKLPYANTNVIRIASLHNELGPQKDLAALVDARINMFIKHMSQSGETCRNLSALIAMAKKEFQRVPDQVKANDLPSLRRETRIQILEKLDGLPYEMMSLCEGYVVASDIAAAFDVYPEFFRDEAQMSVRSVASIRNPDFPWITPACESLFLLFYIGTYSEAFAADGYEKISFEFQFADTNRAPLEVRKRILSLTEKNISAILPGVNISCIALGEEVTAG